jgi:hypothetical protein
LRWQRTLKINAISDYGRFSKSVFEVRIAFLCGRVLKEQRSLFPDVPVLILAIAIICLVSLTGCGTTFAPPPVTTELVQNRTGTHGNIAILREGRTLFVHRCIECHTLPPFWHYRIEDWPHIVDTMSRRANLKPAERDAIIAYILAVRAQ